MEDDLEQLFEGRPQFELDTHEEDFELHAAEAKRISELGIEKCLGEVEGVIADLGGFSSAYSWIDWEYLRGIKFLSCEDETYNIVARNERWVSRIQELLKKNQGSPLVAVGCDHLIGPSGLLSRFQKLGFRVSAWDGSGHYPETLFLNWPTHDIEEWDYFCLDMGALNQELIRHY